MTKWGIYLRAPDEFLNVVETSPPKWKRLDEVADVRFGTLTGLNEFYCPRPTASGYELFQKVDPAYRIPLVRTPKDIDGYVIEERHCEGELFVCSEAKGKLKGAGTRAYIEWAEKQKKKGVLWPKMGEMATRTPWYSTRTPVRGDVTFQMFIGMKHFTPANPKNFVITNNLLGGTVKNPENKAVFSAICNSNWFALCAELHGRVNLGEGALKIEKTDLDGYPLPDLSLFNAAARKRMHTLFLAMTKGAPASIDTEAYRPERTAIDRMICDVFGLPAGAEANIANAVVSLAREREEIAEMRRFRSSQRVVRDVAEVANEIVSIVLPSGTRRFPEDFCSTYAELTSVPVPASDLKVISAPRIKHQDDIFGNKATYVIAGSDGYELQVTDPETVEIIFFAQNGSARTVIVPKGIPDQAAILAAYKDYIAAIKGSIEEAVRERVLDGGLVRGLAEKILEDAGVVTGKLSFRPARVAS